MKNLLVLCFVYSLASLPFYARGETTRETFVFSKKKGAELKLDRYIDNSVVYSGKRPVFIYVHGGGFSTGSRVNALQEQYCRHFAQKGYVAVQIDYRLGIKAGEKADNPTIIKAVSMATEDLIDATAFILSKAVEWNIDPERIIISGGSAGAITCLNTEYDICTTGKFTGRLPVGFNYAGIISHAGAIVEINDTLKWSKTPCPLLLMQGTKDQLVPFDLVKSEGMTMAGSNYIHKQLVSLNVPHWFYEETGADHIVALKPLQYNFAETDTFIDRLVMKREHAVIHTSWADEKPDSMDGMMKVVPLYITGWDKYEDQLK